jgi:hypothetical protein
MKNFRSLNEKFSELSSIEPGFKDSKSNLSSILIWIGIFTWLIRVTVFVRQRHGSERFTDIDILALIQMGAVFWLMSIIILNPKTKLVFSKTSSTSLFFLLLYYTLCGFSTLWSPLMEFTLYRSLEFLVLLISVFVAFSYSSNFIKAENLMLLVITLIIVLSFYLRIKITHLSFTLSSLHSNNYPASSAILFTYCFGEYLNCEQFRKKKIIFFGLLGLGPLFLGTSSASFIAAFGGICLALFLKRKTSLIIFIFFIISCAILIGIDFTFLKEIVFYGKSDRVILTGHGRVYAAKTFFNIFLEKPIFGHGFATLTYGTEHVFEANPHISVFSVLLGTGLMGAIIVFGFLIRLMRELLKTTFKRLPGSIGCASAIFTGFINSLSIPIIFDEWREGSLAFSCVLSFFIFFVLIPYINSSHNSRHYIKYM